MELLDYHMLFRSKYLSLIELELMVQSEHHLHSILMKEGLLGYKGGKCEECNKGYVRLILDDNKKQNQTFL